jgi:hypothetical protein
VRLCLCLLYFPWKGYHPVRKIPQTWRSCKNARSKKCQRYTRLDNIRNEVIRKELEIDGIQDVRSKHKQNWINDLERTDNIRLPKQALKYMGADKSLARQGRLTGHLQPRRNWPTFASNTLITHPILRIWPRRTTTCSLG